jgi:nucleotide-binding universal stress UspA family protein
MFVGPRITVVSVGDALDETLVAGTQRHASSPQVGPTDPKNAPIAIAARTARTLREAGRRARATYRVGNPSGQILDVVKRRAADLIVLGSRGHTGLNRLTLGSIAREVLLAADTSVMICPIDADVSQATPAKS